MYSRLLAGSFCDTVGEHIPWICQSDLPLTHKKHFPKIKIKRQCSEPGGISLPYTRSRASEHIRGNVWFTKHSTNGRPRLPEPQLANKKEKKKEKKNLLWVKEKSLRANHLPLFRCRFTVCNNYCEVKEGQCGIETRSWADEGRKHNRANRVWKKQAISYFLIKKFCWWMPLRTCLSVKQLLLSVRRDAQGVIYTSQPSGVIRQKLG